jgi:hypothetical protein
LDVADLVRSPACSDLSRFSGLSNKIKKKLLLTQAYYCQITVV